MGDARQAEVFVVEAKRFARWVADLAQIAVGVDVEVGRAIRRIGHAVEASGGVVLELDSPASRVLDVVDAVGILIGDAADRLSGA